MQVDSQTHGLITDQGICIETSGSRCPSECCDEKVSTNKLLRLLELAPALGSLMKPEEAFQNTVLNESSKRNMQAQCYCTLCKDYPCIIQMLISVPPYLVAILILRISCLNVG